MTREQLNKHWKEIEAFKNGAEIECRYGNEAWAINDEPRWLTELEYRVKPKAREWWCIVNEHGHLVQTFNEKPPEIFYNQYEIAHVREVVE